MRVEPDLINTVPGRATLGLDLRSASGDHLVVHDASRTYARERAAAREQPISHSPDEAADPPTPRWPPR